MTRPVSYYLADRGKHSGMRPPEVLARAVPDDNLLYIPDAFGFNSLIQVPQIQLDRFFAPSDELPAGHMKIFFLKNRKVRYPIYGLTDPLI